MFEIWLEQLNVRFTMNLNLSFSPVFFPFDISAISPLTAQTKNLFLSGYPLHLIPEGSRNVHSTDEQQM